MKRSAHETDAENPVQNYKKKCTAKLCPPFCADVCPYSGSHDQLILSLVNLQDRTGLEEWKIKIDEARESRDLNQPLEDPDPELRYPLLHWAAMLGKVKAVAWLLQQEFIGFTQNPAQLVCSPSNLSNETVLFSTVRFLHEGVESRHTGEILDKYFVKTLDAFIKHNPKVLLVQEGRRKDTVLHLCARREEDSTAPFFDYLKRILGKLEEYSKKNDSRLPLNKILETRNEEGDAFLHLLAKSKADKREKANGIINIAKRKFPMQFLGEMKNNDGKTAEEIWNEFRQDPELFQTSSQEIHDCPSILKASCKDDERPSKGVGTVGTSGNQGCPGGSEEDFGVKRLQIQSQSLLASQCNEVQSDGGSGNKGDDPHKEIPPRLFQAPFSDKSCHFTSSQSVDEEIDRQHVLQTEEPDEAKESDLHPGSNSNTDTQGGTLNVVKKLIHQTKLKKKKLEQEKKILKEYEDKVKEQKAVVQALEEEVQANENELSDCKVALSF